VKRPLVAAVAALLLVLPARAGADVGTLLIHCQANVSQRASVDPLEFYGTKPSPHNHTPAGAMAFSSTSTVREMMASPTSCEPSTDHSMLWVPTPLQRDGKPARISAFDYYLINSGYRVGKTPPDGLRFMAGDPHCTGQLCPAIYICQQWNRQILSQHTIPTRSDGCDTAGGEGYDMLVYSPGQCWGGKSLGMGMGASTPAAAITGAKPCRGLVIPRIAMSLSVGADGLGGYLSSDIRAGTTKSSPGSTGHFDYVLGWKRGVLTAIIEHCLNTTRFKPGQASCDELTNTAGTSIYQIGSGYTLSSCVVGPSCRPSKSSGPGTAGARAATRGATALPTAAVESRSALVGAGRMLDALAAFLQSRGDSAGGAVRTR
jgi:hypothetical protein